MWIEALTFGLATAGLIYINWDKWFPKKETKSIPLEQVIKEAESALQYNPLEEAKKKPEAIKPLLRVLLEIREKKAEEELREEERQRDIEAKVQRANELLRRERAKCVLSGRIEEGHPHFQFTEAGRRAAQQALLAQQQNINPKYQAEVYDLNKQTDDYVTAPRYDVAPEEQQNTTIGYNALSQVENKNTILGIGAVGAAALAGLQAFHKHKRR